jgi:hypothetical protein
MFSPDGLELGLFVIRSTYSTSTVRVPSYEDTSEVRCTRRPTRTRTLETFVRTFVKYRCTTRHLYFRKYGSTEVLYGSTYFRSSLLR